MHTPLTYGAGFPGRPAKLVEKRLARRTPVRLGRHAAPLNGFTFHAPASLAARVQRRRSEERLQLAEKRGGERSQRPSNRGTAALQRLG